MKLLRRDLRGIGGACLGREEGLDGPGGLCEKLVKLVGMDATIAPVKDNFIGVFSRGYR